MPTTTHRTWSRGQKTVHLFGLEEYHERVSSEPPELPDVKAIQKIIRQVDSSDSIDVDNRLDEITDLIDKDVDAAVHYMAEATNSLDKLWQAIKEIKTLTRGPDGEDIESLSNKELISIIEEVDGLVHDVWPDPRPLSELLSERLSPGAVRLARLYPFLKHKWCSYSERCGRLSYRVAGSGWQCTLDIFEVGSLQVYFPDGGGVSLKQGENQITFSGEQVTFMTETAKSTIPMEELATNFDEWLKPTEEDLRFARALWPGMACDILLKMANHQQRLDSVVDTTPWNAL